MIKLFNEDCRLTLQEHLKECINPVIVTDPPFNLGYHYNTYKDNLKEEDYYNELVSLFERIPFVIIHYPEAIYKLAIKLGYAPEKVISWVYNCNTARQHRDIAFFRIKPDLNKVKQPYKNPRDKRIQQRIAEGKTGCRLYDWWEINQIKNVSKTKIGIKHPCVMPLEVMKRIIGVLPDDITIVDPFLGSGTTALAAKELNRDFLGIEIDKDYFELSNQRMEGNYGK